MLNLQAIESIINQLPQAQKYWVAYSGGIDSHVLLHILATFFNPQLRKRLQAVHINHGISQNANQWEQHCKATCRQLGVPCQVVRVKVYPHKGESLEALARNARYQAFARLMEVGDCLLTAHQQNDQSETLLLQLFRGAGVKGLSGMRPIRTLAKGKLCRPFLNYNRKALQQYAKQAKLVWINDESNADLAWDRNYLRHQILPLVQKRWPGGITTIQRSSQHCAVADQLLDDLAALDYQVCVGPVTNTLAIKMLQTLSPNRQVNLLRYWISLGGYPLPNHRFLERMLTEVISSRQSASPLVAWDTVEVRRYQGHLYLQSALSYPDPKLNIAWDVKKPLTLPGQIGTLHAQYGQGKGLVIPANENLRIKFRQGGERCQPQDRVGSQKLKKLFQEWGVPPWMRDRIPLIFRGEQLLCVVGYCVHKPFAARKDQLGWEIKLTHYA